MKHLQFYCLAIILTALFACEPPITFDAPQPVDVDNLTKFPKRLKGKFISLADSSFLLITDNLIVREHHFLPTEIDAFFLDDIDYHGLEYWYNDILEVNKELNKK